MSSQKTSSHRPRRMAREPDGDSSSAPMRVAVGSKPADSKVPSKSSMLLGLLGRDDGATLDQMVEATSWLPHTTRAALTSFKKKGHIITSERIEGIRTYRLAQDAAQ